MVEGEKPLTIEQSPSDRTGEMAESGRDRLLIEGMILHLETIQRDAVKKGFHADTLELLAKQLNEWRGLQEKRIGQASEILRGNV